MTARRTSLYTLTAPSTVDRGDAEANLDVARRAASARGAAVSRSYIDAGPGPYYTLTITYRATDDATARTIALAALPYGAEYAATRPDVTLVTGLGAHARTVALLPPQD